MHCYVQLAECHLHPVPFLFRLHVRGSSFAAVRVRVIAVARVVAGLGHVRAAQEQHQPRQEADAIRTEEAVQDGR